MARLKAKAPNTPQNPVATPVMAYGHRIDTTIRRKVVRKLTDALYDFLTVELDEIELQAKLPPPQFPKYATPEMLVRATEEANAMREQIEISKAALENLPDGIREMMRAGILMPLEGMLRQQEQRVSAIQAELES